jgi:hypothetical protein
MGRGIILMYFDSILLVDGVCMRLVIGEPWDWYECRKKTKTLFLECCVSYIGLGVSRDSTAKI